MNGPLAIVLAAAPVLTTLVVGFLVVRRVRQARNAAAGAMLQRAPDGEVVVPVSGLFRGASKNSLKPFLAITPDDLRFKVLWEERWPFSEIVRVDVRKTLVGANLSLVNRRKGGLTADLASLGLARQVLAALPRSVPLTTRAAALRDGPAAD